MRKIPYFFIASQFVQIQGMRTRQVYCATVSVVDQSVHDYMRQRVHINTTKQLRKTQNRSVDLENFELSLTFGAKILLSAIMICLDSKKVNATIQFRNSLTIDYFWSLLNRRYLRANHFSAPKRHRSSVDEFAKRRPKPNMGRST